MSVNLNIAADFATVADNLETITLLPQAGSSMAVENCLRRAIAAGEGAPSAGRYTAADLDWHLPASALSQPPAVGDVIADADGSAWSVLQVRVQTLGSRYRCTCRQLGIAGGLDAQLRIDVATSSKGADGAAEITWTVWRPAVRGRAQPLDAAAEVNDFQQTERRRYLIYLAEDLELDASHRIVDADGAVFAVKGRNGAQRIDGLSVIHAERVDL